MARVALYAGKELGAFGWHEKPWNPPGRRLEAFLGALEASGLADAVDFRHAEPATDADLGLFHRPGYVEEVRRRCATNQGSLDRAADRVIDDALLRLRAVERHGAAGAPVSAVRDAIEAEAMPGRTFDGFVGYLVGEGVIEHDGGALRLTATGRAFLTDPQPWLGGPTFARRHVEEAARWIVGAAVDATRHILAGELQTVFIPIAGYHHAHPDEARLYCLYNDPAIAIRAALELIDGPIAYIDIDIHHGDGVYEGFAEDPRVIVADLYEQRSPDEVPRLGGRGSAEGTKLTLPIPPQTDDAGYLGFWEEAEAFVRAARPAFVVFECGVDGLHTDPMSNQRITVDAIATVARRVRAIAHDHAGGRLLVLGGGGYELQGTAAAWVAVVRSLL